MRRRKFGRQFKLIADLALLLGSSVTHQQEASQGIEVAIQELKAQNDFSWLAYGHETKAACMLAAMLLRDGSATGSGMIDNYRGGMSMLGSFVATTGT